MGASFNKGTATTVKPVTHGPPWTVRTTMTSFNKIVVSVVSVFFVVCVCVSVCVCARVRARACACFNQIIHSFSDKYIRKYPYRRTAEIALDRGGNHVNLRIQHSKACE
jgi:hypothetical protein